MKAKAAKARGKAIAQPRELAAAALIARRIEEDIVSAGVIRASG